VGCQRAVVTLHGVFDFLADEALVDDIGINVHPQVALPSAPPLSAHVTSE
jgi:ABC-type Zn uptake system ZnuABC Zn-binding protein ZnuA